MTAWVSLERALADCADLSRSSPKMWQTKAAARTVSRCVGGALASSIAAGGASEKASQISTLFEVQFMIATEWLWASNRDTAIALADEALRLVQEVR